MKMPVPDLQKLAGQKELIDWFLHKTVQLEEESRQNTTRDGIQWISWEAVRNI